MSVTDADGLRRQHRWTTTPELLTLDARLTDRAHRVWCRLDRFAGDGANGGAFPSRKTLAVELRCSLSSLDRALEELVTFGWLTKQRREAGGTNLYTLIDTLSPEGEQNLLATLEQSRVVMRRHLGLEQGALVTSDERVSSLVTRGVVMGDAQKEASPNEASVKGGGGVSEVSTEATPPQHPVTERPFPRFAIAALGSETTPQQQQEWMAAWHTVTAIATVLDPTENLTKYFARCKERKTTPKPPEWIRWFVDDQIKERRAAEYAKADSKDAPKPWFE